jgi:hypothetical protein
MKEVLTIDAKDQRVGLFVEPPNAKLKISATRATEMTRDDIIHMAREAGWTEYSLLHAVEVQRLETFAALVAAAEQRTISDVTEAVTKTVIEVEKLLCGKLGRQWQPSGMSIQTLVDELAAPPTAAPEPKSKTPAWWMDGLTATLMREGVNKHRAKEIAKGYWEAYCQVPMDEEQPR